MRVAADGYLDISDGRRVRTPGFHDHRLDPVPEEEAIAFLLSHNFRGHRRIVRPLSVADRKRIRLALWADSVSERMTLVDRVWRSITESVMPPVGGSGEPHLIQVIRYGNWAYPLYIDGDSTRVIPLSGMPIAEVPEEPSFEFDAERKTA
jgi:hypothetical protein